MFAIVIKDKIECWKQNKKKILERSDFLFNVFTFRLEIT